MSSLTLKMLGAFALLVLLAAPRAWCEPARPLREEITALRFVRHDPEGLHLYRKVSPEAQTTWRRALAWLEARQEPFAWEPGGSALAMSAVGALVGVAAAASVGLPVTAGVIAGAAVGLGLEALFENSGGTSLISVWRSRAEAYAHYRRMKTEILTRESAESEPGFDDLPLR